MDIERLLANTADGGCAIDTAGRIAAWNRAAERILGHAAEDVLGRPCCEVFVGHDADGKRLCHQGCHIMALVRSGEAVEHFRMATRAKGGKRVWLDVSILAVARRQRVLDTTVYLFRDASATHALEQLVRERLAARTAGTAGPNVLPSSLSPREAEVLRLLADGATTVAIAARLQISRATVRNHVQSILAKLGAHNRLEAVALATRRRPT